MADQISTVRVKIETGQEVTLTLSFVDAPALPTLGSNQDGAIQIDVETGDERSSASYGKLASPLLPTYSMYSN